MNNEIHHNPATGRFDLQEAGETAFLSYMLEEEKMNMLSVQVPPGLEGRGIAAALTQAALEFAKANGYSVIATCPYVKTYLVRHPEYQALLA